MIVRMYSQATCIKCQSAKVWLGQLKIPFEILDVYAVEGAMQQLIDWKIQTIPAFIIGDEVIGGFDKRRILQAVVKEMDREIADGSTHVL